MYSEKDWADTDIGGRPVQVVAVGVPLPHPTFVSHGYDTCIIAWQWAGDKKRHRPELRFYTMDGKFSPFDSEGILEHSNLKLKEDRVPHDP